jgi:hypothetical protein
MLQEGAFPLGDGGVTDAVETADLYLRALTLEYFQDELELEHRGVDLRFLEPSISPPQIEGEDTIA